MKLATPTTSDGAPGIRRARSSVVAIPTPPATAPATPARKKSRAEEDRDGAGFSVIRLVFAGSFSERCGRAWVCAAGSRTAPAKFRTPPLQATTAGLPCHRAAWAVVRAGRQPGAGGSADPAVSSPGIAPRGRAT
jgi:hypothetical protein